MEPTGAYWLGDLGNNLAAGSALLVGGTALVAWLADLNPVELVTATLDRLLGR